MPQNQLPNHFNAIGCADGVAGPGVTEAVTMAPFHPHKLNDSFHCQLAWESRWEDVGSPYLLMLGEFPSLMEMAQSRTQRYQIPTVQRFCLPSNHNREIPGFRVVHEGAFAQLDERDRLEVIGQFVQDRLLLLFRWGEKWHYECWGPPTLASHLKQIGLRRIGTLYLIASRLGAADFLPSLAQELTVQGIQYDRLCSPEGYVHLQQDSIVTPRRQIRAIAKSMTFSIAEKQHAISKWGPMLREEGPDFHYEIIVQVGNDSRIEESAGTLVANSPFRTCWIKWDPLQGNWQVIHGEPRFLRWNTRWAIVAPSINCPEQGPLFAGLNAHSLAIRFLGLLHAVEAWQEIHGKLSHLLLIGPDLFLAAKKKNEEFAFQLAHKFAAFGRRIPIRVRDFVQQKDIAGRLHSGHLTTEAPVLQWSCHPPPWERDFHWDMGRLVTVDAPVYEPEVPFRGPNWLPRLTWKSSFHCDFSWISKCIVATRWRENIRRILTDIFQEKVTLPPVHCIPILETAALDDEPNLLWMNMSQGEVLGIGTCCQELREFEVYFRTLFEDLFAAFQVDGDFRLQRRIGVSPHHYETAFEAALSLLCLIHPVREEYVQLGLEVRLCSEFLKNLGERISGKRGVLMRAWRAASRDCANAEISGSECRRMILGALGVAEVSDEYELARIDQFSARCTQNSAPALCWQDFSGAVPIIRRFLGNACEYLPTAPHKSKEPLKQNEAEKYFQNLQIAGKNPIGSFQNTSEGILWNPPAFAVILEIDLRPPWVCFGTPLLYSSTHEGRNERTANGMPYVQVDHAGQLPFPIVWSRILALDLWRNFGGPSRVSLPLKPDIVMLPITPAACIDYQWGAYDSEPDCPQDSAFRQLAETGHFHPLYREFENWYVVQKLNFKALDTEIEIFLDSTTKLLIFPKEGMHSRIRYHFYGGGGNYRCSVCFGFTAEIECEDASESWTFESSDNSLLEAIPDGVKGEGISIRFTGVRPRKISISTNGEGRVPFGDLETEAIQAVSCLPSKSLRLPGMFLGVIGDFHVRFDIKTRSLHSFYSESLESLGPLKTIYARANDRFDRVGIHDGCCFAIEYLLSPMGDVLELTYRLSPSGWALIIISTDIDSFFTELKQTRQIHCPLDEFLLRWLDVDAILGMEEGEEEGILPQLAEVVLVCPKSRPSVLPLLWVRTSDNSVLWHGHYDSTSDSQNPRPPKSSGSRRTVPRTGSRGKEPSKVSPVPGQVFRITVLHDQTQFLFQRNNEIFFKNTSDPHMFRIGQGNQLKHLANHGRWMISSQSMYSLAAVPLHMGWQVVDSLHGEAIDDLLDSLGDQLRCPILAFIITSPNICESRMLFLDAVEKIAFPTPLHMAENKGWFLGRESQSGFAYWWLPRDHLIFFSQPLPIPSVQDPVTNPPKCDTIRPPDFKAPTGAGIADGFLYLRSAKGHIYRRVSDGSWRIIRLFCSCDSTEQIFCEIADVLPQTDASILPLEIMSGAGSPHVGWFLRNTAQIIKSPIEAGDEAILLGSSNDGEKHYVFGQNRIFEIRDSVPTPHGRATFAFRKNGVLLLVADYIIDPPILNAEKLILLGSSQCLRWKLGEGLLSYQLILVESSSSRVIAGILDLRPLSIQDCGCWVENEDFVIAELATGNRLVIRNGQTALFPTDFVEKLGIRFAEFENCLSLQDLLNIRGSRQCST